MMNDQVKQVGFAQVLAVKVRAYMTLLKFRLSFLVAFSSGFGYWLATKGNFDTATLFMLCFGGFLVSGASITMNQIIEKNLDKLMERTKNRPLPTGLVSEIEAKIFALIVGAAGLIILLYYTNPITTVLSFISMVLYSFVYTPLKRVGPVAVFVGAIPGALPPLLGWTAATGMVSYEALIIFSIQFIWQFPHFWAIAWVAHDDYAKAGFKMLPGGGSRDLKTAFNIMIYTLFLLPLGLLPAKIGITGLNSAVIATVCGVLFLVQAFVLMRDGTRKAAMKMMFGSFIYLPVVQIAYLLDMI